MSEKYDFSIITQKYNEFQATCESSLRYLHGRGGKYPGFEQVIIDWYSPLFYIRFFEKNILLENELVHFFHETHKHNLLIHHRDTNLFINYFNEQLDLSQIMIKELNLRYKLKLGFNQNIGFFPDMKVLREWILSRADFFAGKKVLNLFSYTCSLSVASLAAGASEIHNVDSVSNVLNWGRENHALNFEISKNVYYHKIDILKSFNWIIKKGPFDVVICDPPSFQKGSFDYQKDYKKIINRADQMLNEDGIFIACLNAPKERLDFLVNLFKEFRPDFELLEVLLAPIEYEEIDKEQGLKICIFKKVNNV